MKTTNKKINLGKLLGKIPEDNKSITDKKTSNFLRIIRKIHEDNRNTTQHSDNQTT